MAEIKKDKKDIEDNKIIAALGYVWILCLVPLFLKRNSKFAQFHAKQGVLLLIVETVAFIIPVIGWFFYIIALIYALIGIKSALEGKYWEMPILGKYAFKLNV